MAASDVLSIWNNAILDIGAKTQIAAITEQSAEAAACALKYRDVVEDIIRKTDWGCLRTRVALIEASAGAVWPPSWEYMFYYPTNCFAIRGFDIGALGLPRILPVTEVPFELGFDSIGTRVLYMNMLCNVVVFTQYNYDPLEGYFEAMFDASLRKAVSAALGAAVAGPLTGNAGIVQQARQAAVIALEEAKAANGNEAAPVDLTHAEAESLAVRGYTYCDYPSYRWR